MKFGFFGGFRPENALEDNSLAWCILQGITTITLIILYVSAATGLFAAENSLRTAKDSS